MTKSAESRAAAFGNALWRTSSYTASNGNCVEVAVVSDIAVVAVRDTKDRSIPSTQTSCAAWTAFIKAAKSGALDCA
ncbi:DUF397 domain-containing protein [Streptomyces millisiae]|uniref:DUF397 domain-containing protein n=1 Tax=Streptomyces millisiae TaxID=3075542 RepID=A0ABU2LSH1_9ACTN|nr:DUF397 domain-containing protein [Streptomyces sp. DSM 44918]MDT0320542.1 DUF397 domain-containing protein [Streptomyces sp. DSM 44918]